MEDRRLIAEALLDLAKNSTTTFIEVAEDKELIEAAKKIGVILPSPDLAVIKTVYAEIDKANRNGVVLPKKAVEEGLPTLIGKQINWEHDGAGRICGYIIDAKINKDKIEIIGVIFKSLFPEEMDKVKEKFEKGELTVSFEIWNRDEQGNSVVHELDNGYRAIDPIIFHGCGLLLAHQPACPKAKVYKLVAKVIENAEKIVDRIFEKDLVFASLVIEEPKCKNCGACNCKEKEEEIMEELVLTDELIASFENDYEDVEFEEAKKLTYEQRKNLKDEDFAVVIEKDGKKIRMFPIHDEAHVRNALARLGQEKVKETLKRLGVSIEEVEKKILKRAKELNMTELLERYKKAEETSSEETKTEETKVETKTEEVAETKAEETKVEETKEEVKAEETKVEAETTTEEKKEEVVEEKTEEIKPEEKKEEAQSVEEVKSPRKLIKIVTLDGTEVTEIFADGASTSDSKRKIVTIRYFDDGTDERSESYEEVVRTYSYAELEEKINAVKFEKEKEIADLKTVNEELDKEIKKLQDELGKKDQEIAELKTPKVEEPKKEKELTVGAVEGEKDSEIKRQAANINKIIAEGKGKG